MIRRRLDYVLWWGYYFLVVRSCALLSLRGAHRFMQFWAVVKTKLLNHQYRTAVRRNLLHVFGVPSDRARLERLVNDHCAMMATEHLQTFLYGRLKPKLCQAPISTHGLHHLDRALSRGKGVIFLTGHFGRFEILLVVLRKMGYALSVLTQDISAHNQNLSLAKYHYARAGSKPWWDLGIGQIQFGSYLRPVYRNLARNEMIMIVMDAQLGAPENRSPVKFLGGTMLIHPGFARLALTSGAAIVPFFVYADTPYHKIGVIEEPIFPSVQGDQHQEIDALVQSCASVLEKYVSRYPEQYWGCSYIDYYWSVDASSS